MRIFNRVLSSRLFYAARLSPGLKAIVILILISPSLALMYYIRLFAVNVIFWDEWEVVPLFAKMTMGTLSLSDLFSQHNEHRLFLSYLVMLGVDKLSSFDTVAESMLSWLLICFTGLLIYLSLRRRFPEQSNLSKLVLYLPISVLLFSFRQYESILWGWPVTEYISDFAVVAAFFLLEGSRKVDVRFLLAFLSGAVASFSLFNGLLVWPVGLFQVMAGSKKTARRRTILWGLVGVGTFLIYFHGWVKPLPPLNYVLSNPIVGVDYLLAIIGAPFTFDPLNALAYGSVILVIGVLTLIRGLKARVLARSGLFLSLAFFGFLSAFATTVGRSGLGVDQALSSRYTHTMALGIIGLYLLANFVCKKHAIHRRSFETHALLAIIVLGAIVSYHGGWQDGVSWQQSRQLSAYLLRTYQYQSGANMQTYLYPASLIFIHEWASYLEQRKLNVFAETQLNVSYLPGNATQALYSVNTVTVDGTPAGEPYRPGLSQIISVGAGDHTMTITGWAFDRESSRDASAVFLVLNGTTSIPALYGLERSDVAEHFRNSNLAYSGWMASFSTSVFAKGLNAVSLEIISSDGIHFYSTQTILFVVVP
jgi:hypothetical protein